MTEKIWWYVARSGGLVAWLILAVATVWGMFISTRILQDKRRPAWLLDLHRWLGALAIIFTSLHLIGLMLDNFVSFSLADIFVPMASEWQPGPVAWGVVGLYFLIAVQISSLVMKKLPRKLWKGIHLTSFIMFWLVSVHAALAGTDTSSTWYKVGSSLIITVVMFVVLYRYLTVQGVKRRKGRPKAAKKVEEPARETTPAS